MRRAAQKVEVVKTFLSSVRQSVVGEVVWLETEGPYNAYVEVYYDHRSSLTKLRVGYYEIVREQPVLRMVGQANSEGFKVSCPGLAPQFQDSEPTLSDLRKPGTKKGSHDGIQCYGVAVVKGTGKGQLRSICLQDFSYIK